MAAGKDEDGSNTFKILLATDVHLGYAERDPVRGNDSLVTFEEILEKAQEHSVDFILLGGDLFHENKPSRRVMHGCLTLLRKYCMGDRPIQFEFLSDQSINFEHCRFPVLNYEDPNLNISIPVFSIHGNHDDPTGPGNLCSLDIIHSAGFLNYFGKTTSLERIQLSPLLLQKGSTKLALYGLGSVRDERLHRLFMNKNVTMLRPRENKEDWFNLFVLHQNRAKHSETNYIPEHFLDEFLDLVFWGHEHECRLTPEWNDQQSFYVTQPGSSIATSLSEGETNTKHIGLLRVDGKDFKITPIRLETVRQFYLENIVLSETSLDPEDHNAVRKVEAFCREKVERLIEKAASEHTGNKRQPKEPLIRLKIDYTGFETFSIYRFGRNFMNRVANPDQIVNFTRKKATRSSSKENDDGELSMTLKPLSLDTARVEDMVRDYFSRADPGSQLQVLTEKGLGEAVKEFVDKEEKEAITELVKYQLEKTQNHLKVRNINQDDIDAEVHRFKEQRQKKKEEDEEVHVAMKRAQVIQSQGEDNAFSEEDVRMDTDSDDASHTSQTPRGRGRGRGQGRGQSGRGRGSRSKTVSDDMEDRPTSGKGSRGGRRGRGKSAVVAGPQTRSISDMFPTSSRGSRFKSGNGSASKSYFDNEDDDSEGEGLFGSIPPVRQKTGSARASETASKRGVVFDSDTDEEEFLPSVKKRR